MTRGLRIAEGLELPVDFVTQASAILARKGKGKTYTGSVILEEVIRARVPSVTFDPTGAWWGIRSSADGKSPGLPAVIFGGDHGDVPLDREAGPELADVVLEHPGAYVLDLSAIPSRQAEQRFAADFLERLYRRKRPDSGPLLLIVDEADLLAPQRPGPEQVRTLGALEQIVRRGRIKGLGDLLITQRPAVLNKNVLTQTEVLIVGQITGPQDRAALDDWIEQNATPEERAEFLRSLAVLDPAEKWVWSPSFLGTFRRVRIRQRETYDSSRTPKAGERIWTPTEFARIDVATLGARIAAAVDQAKANDPEALKRRVRELEGQVATLEAREPAGQPEPYPVPVLAAGELDDLRRLHLDTRDLLERFGERLAETNRTVAIAESIASDDELPWTNGRRAKAAARPDPTDRATAERGPRGVPGSPAGDRGQTTVATLAPAAPSRKPSPATGGGGGVEGLTGYGRRLLDTLASRHPMTLTKSQLGMLSGSSRKSSSFDSAIKNVRDLGLVEAAGGQFVVTKAGWDALGGTPPAAVTPDEVRATWRAALPGSVAPAVFDVLVARYPSPVTKAEVAEATGGSPTSSTFDAAFTYLRRAGLLEDLAPGVIRAAEILFA